MTEWIETHPEVEVQAAEYQRLLGYPPGYVMEGRARELTGWALEWYAEHGRPWIYAREVQSVGTGGASVNIEGVRFHSGVLRPRFEPTPAARPLLAVFGLPRKREGVRRLAEVVGCESCSVAARQYRRMTGKP